MVLAMPRRSPLTTAPDAEEETGSKPAQSQGPRGRALEIGGYRLVRRLDDDSDVSTWVARGSDETVVLRVFRDTADDARIDAEALARERLLGAHAPELLDIATGPSGRPALVVRAVIGPTLDDLLARLTGPLRAGHLTTLLAPLAALVAAAHETGATLGRLDASAIRIDPAGRPVIVALGRARVAAPLPERFRHQEPEIVDDRDRLDALAAELAQRVDPHERASVERALASATGHPELLELALFDCAAPMPVLDLASAGRDRELGSASVSRGMADDRAARVSDRFPPAPDITVLSGQLDDPEPCTGGLEQLGQQVGMPVGLLRPLDVLLQRLRQRVESLGRGGSREGGSRSPRASRASRARAGRPGRAVVIAGVAGGVSLLAAIVLATGSGETTADESRPSSSSPSAPTASPAEAPPAAATTDLPETAVDPSADEWAPLTAALVDRYLTCAGDPTAACAAEATQSDSAASEQLLGPAEKRTVITQTLGAWAATARESLVVDRHGGAVVVDLIVHETTTASLLVMRSEAGWRLRAVMPSVSD